MFTAMGPNLISKHTLQVPTTNDWKLRWKYFIFVYRSLKVTSVTRKCSVWISENNTQDFFFLYTKQLLEGCPLSRKTYLLIEIAILFPHKESQFWTGFTGLLLPLSFCFFLYLLAFSQFCVMTHS